MSASWTTGARIFPSTGAVTTSIRIRYERFLDATVAREALRAGIVDVWTESDMRHWFASFDTPATARGWLKRGYLDSGDQVGARVRVVLNTQREPFDDPKVREALTLALDFGWQNRTLHGGERSQAHSYFANSMFASSGLPTDAELALLEPFRATLPKEVFTEEFAFATSDGVGVNRDQLIRARALLAEEGWQIKNGVLVNDEGKPFTIEFLTASADNQRILNPLRQVVVDAGYPG